MADGALAMSDHLSPDARVLIQGLRARADLNGLQATCLSWHGEGERWAVRTLLGEGVRVKPANLVRCAGLLEAGLDDDLLVLFLSQNPVGAVRLVAACSRKCLQLSKRVLTSDSYRRAEDLRQLTQWKASSPVFGFYSIDGNACLLYTSPSPRDAHES
eukprot:7075731-Prymnesium_polylepis.1